MLFAIDVSASMLEPPPPTDQKKADKDSAVAAALKCAYQFMQQRIIAQPKDMMGILFFGTEKSKFRDEAGGRSGTGYPHCYLFTDLDVPAAEDVKKLKALAEEGEDADEVLVPAKEPASMANVLFCANQVFTTNAANFGSRRLFIITDNDNPHVNDKNAKAAAAVRAKDLYDLGVVIELFPISRGEKRFDISKFYDVRTPGWLLFFFFFFVLLGKHMLKPADRTSSTAIQQQRRVCRMRSRRRNRATGSPS